MISIDYQSRLPLYEQIVRRFQALILQGVLPADTQMPSVRSLAVELSINPNTIQKAYSLLEQQGYIYPVKGRGNFVADNSALLRQKQELILRDFRQQVSHGKDLGITKSEFMSILNILYENDNKEESGHD